MAGTGQCGKGGERENRLRRAAMLHPLRQRIARRLATGEAAGVTELAAELNQAPSRIAYHLRQLQRRGALAVVPKRRPTPPLYRWAEAGWATEMLCEQGDR